MRPTTAACAALATAAVLWSWLRRRRRRELARRYAYELLGDPRVRRAVLAALLAARARGNHDVLTTLPATPPLSFASAPHTWGGLRSRGCRRSRMARGSV